jgi:hypothetical protein
MQSLGMALAKGGQPRQRGISGAQETPAQWNLRRESPAPNLMKRYFQDYLLFLLMRIDFVLRRIVVLSNYRSAMLIKRGE